MSCPHFGLRDPTSARRCPEALFVIRSCLRPAPSLSCPCVLPSCVRAATASAPSAVPAAGGPGRKALTFINGAAGLQDCCAQVASSGGALRGTSEDRARAGRVPDGGPGRKVPSRSHRGPGDSGGRLRDPSTQLEPRLERRAPGHLEAGPRLSPGPPAWPRPPPLACKPRTHWRSRNKAGFLRLTHEHHLVRRELS